MKILWSLCVLVALYSVDAAHSHKGSQGLSCVNDFVNNVSCTWNGSPVAPDMNCSISVKMHPPGVPTVNSTANETWIWWSEGSPLSKFIKSFIFEVQIKQNHQTWNEAYEMTTQELKLSTNQQLKGHCQVRVRVQSSRHKSHWSDWSPTTSWIGAPDVVEPSQNEEWPLDRTSLVRFGVMFSMGLILVVMVVLLRTCSKGLHKEKSVPNPSKYFHTLHSVHGGNLKKWLNPLSAPQSFFMDQPCDHISPVELCDASDVVPSTSPSFSSSSTLLQFKSYPLAGSDTSGVADNSSSSSSSGFSNMGYFLSSSSCGSARTDPNPAYFTYQGDFHNLHNNHNLHLSLWPSITINCPTYESLKREPQSPDSGFGVGNEDEEDKEDKKLVDEEGEGVSDNQQTSPLLILPLHLPPQMCPPSSPPPPPNAPSLTQVSSDESQQVETPVAAASGSYEAWPLAGGMCRSSSMPVEPCRTGYLTLKELQTTFSNKSI
ncbi:interleukin-2 receptor subunit beta [Symphorus nematophorus]